MSRYTRTIDCYRNALDLVSQVCDRYHESLALIYLADAYAAMGDQRGVDTALGGALAIPDELDHPDAGRSRPGRALQCPGRHGRYRRLRSRRCGAGDELLSWVRQLAP